MKEQEKVTTNVEELQQELNKLKKINSYLMTACIIMVVFAFILLCLAATRPSNINVKSNPDVVTDITMETSSKVTQANIVPTSTIQKVDDSYITENEMQAVYSNPDKYKGRRIKLSGRIFSEVEADSDGVYMQMWGDAEKSERPTDVYYANTAIKLASDDYVKVDGIILGEFVGQNKLGGTVRHLMVAANTLEKVSYQDVLSSTIKEVIVNETKIQYGYEVTLQKVEFADNETRVYVSVTNNGNAEFSIYKYSSSITQNSRQYEYQFNYKADYPELNDDLLPGNVTDGIITFPRLELDDIKIMLKANSDNYRENIKPFEFEIHVENNDIKLSSSASAQIISN